MRREIIDARVWAGFDFRNSGAVGVRLGQRVAEWGLDRYLQRTDHGYYDHD